jgi:hypothetical protein
MQFNWSDSQVREDAPRALHIGGWVFVLLAALVVYRGAFASFFVQDDFGWLGDSRFQTFREYAQCFFRFNPALSYRPLSQETFFWLGQKIFGMWPPGFHFFSVSVHLLGGSLLYFILRRFVAPIPASVGALFYTTHGAHFRSVCWISAFPEPSAVACYLGALLLFIRFDREQRRLLYMASVLAMVLGIMCKESILTVPLVLATYCLLFSPRRLLWTTPFFVLSGLYVFFRFTSAAVHTAPYPLTFGYEAWRNLLTYFSWAAGFTDTLLVVKLHWNAESSYAWVAAGLTVALVTLLFISGNKRIALFAVIWFGIALQPVLYFWQHIDPYYLAPALAAFALLISSAFPRMRHALDWRTLVPALLAAWLFLGISWASVRREHQWWTERSYIGREILAKVPQMDAHLPAGRIAYVFGFTAQEFGIMQDDSAFKTYGYSTNRFILVGLDPDTPRQIRTLHGNGGLADYFCFLHARGDFFDMTEEFRKNPEYFLVPVGLEISPKEVRRGRDQLWLRALNFDVPAIDLRYSLDAKPMPDILNWRLDNHSSVGLLVDKSTKVGLYHFLAIRDSRNTSERAWFPIDIRVVVR